MALDATDPNGTKHEYGYNVLGQQTSDYVASFASGVDTTVDKITTSYTTLGNVYLVTSYNSSSDVVNQVEMLYNGLDQEIQEFEAVNGAVNVETTPSVQNTYTNIADGNNSRLTSTIYPDGYTVDYNYNSGLDSDISRLSSLSDFTGTLQSYQYLGLDTIVVMAEPQADLELTYLSTDDSTGDAGDECTGLDRFGRVIEQNWYNTSTDTSVYDDQYILDDDGNVIFKVDTIDSSMGEYFTYDGLNQVTGYERGDVVYLGPDYGVSGTPSVTESFTYDSLGNDLVDSTTTTSTTTLTSAFNYDNQITSISSGTLPTYDSNGNMTKDQNDLSYTYNAWNEAVTVKNSSSTTLETYSYDGLGNRITNTVGSTTTDLYNSMMGQVLEEAVSGDYTQRYVWSTAYVNQLVDRDTDTSDTGLTATGSSYTRVWALQDANYNTVAIVAMSDDVATVVERYAYEPLGTVTVTSGDYVAESGSAYGWVYLFQGWLDTITGNLQFGAWNLNPKLGTWTKGSTAGDAFDIEAPPIGTIHGDRMQNGPGSLKIRVDTLSKVNLGDGGFNVKWQFWLSKPAPVNSYIVQKVTFHLNYETIATGAITNVTQIYWEAWLVKAGQITETGAAVWGYTDEAKEPRHPGTGGTVSQAGEIKVFPASTTGNLGDPGPDPVVDKPDPETGFGGKNQVAMSLDLPSTATQPTWWMNGSPTARRYVSATWNDPGCEPPNSPASDNSAAYSFMTVSP